MDRLWTWGGKYFGYREKEDLWTYSGEYVGRFYDEEVYAVNGSYLGEIRNDDRLIVNCNKKDKKRPIISEKANRTALTPVTGYTGYAMIYGYEDFPAPEKFK